MPVVPEDGDIACLVRITGRVQGVWYRGWTSDEAVQRSMKRSTRQRRPEMTTRRRTNRPYNNKLPPRLERLLSAPCPYCDGRGRIKSIPTMAHEIIRQIQKNAATGGNPQDRITVRASREVISYLYNEEEEAIRLLQRNLDRRVSLKVAEKYHQEQFYIVATS
jgi:Ribonuclease G/E